MSKTKYPTTHTMKDIVGTYEIRMFMKWLNSQLKKNDFISRKGISKRLSGRISQYTSHMKQQPFDEFMIYKDRILRRCESKIRKDITGFVYFIGNIDQGVVKIGYSKKPNKRLSGIQTGCPFKLKILMKMKGNYFLEGEYQKRFKESKMEGEWFSLEGEIGEFLKEVGVKGLEKSLK